MYRAIIEGLNFALMDGMYGMERRSGQKIRHLYLGGGGSRSDEICQITANMFGLPVSRIQTHESCALGAAICSFVSLGKFTSYEDAIAHMVRIRDTFTPDAEEHKLYDRIYREVYRRYYRAVTPLHKLLGAITRNGKIRKTVLCMKRRERFFIHRIRPAGGRDRERCPRRKRARLKYRGNTSSNNRRSQCATEARNYRTAR